MKNIKDRINSQLFKAQEVELSAEKVELGIADDINKMLSNVQKMIDKVEPIEKMVQDKSIAEEYKNKAKDAIDKINEQMVKKYEGIFDKAEKGISQADALENKSYTLIRKAEDAADALGVNPNSIKGLSELEDATSNLEDIHGQIKADLNKVDIPLITVSIK